MQVTDLEIEGLKLIVPQRFEDERGFFSETYSEKALKEAGLTDTFVQDNFSLSTRRGTIRGLHFQRAPHAQVKLVRVNRGRILDVAVDLRRSSPTYGKHVAVELSRENWGQLYLPVGFAHGFCTLEADTEVVYKTSSPYAPEAEGGILWSDPSLAIAWPVNPQDVTVSDKDTRLPSFANMAMAF
ncbi:dTDP-4-dehydrorhamnose 3,5-epimerase [Hyphomicrobium denitrificans 1NES1]|uniref:dTDP-4-dehydrorhamnose 3,5-epimerase n=1 Tax=Hyphomicrobium denitrificans 1NES1 TaxID=670307 RepID=N0B396_9HYPH|nr:dTDP-4-dehydrorhamnose 3,5-epimerase [Hyphomicrobium denitrificans]AGK56687.1 dTDP-4-dehydrorhamnose 3,5-epimerase [Hyphomicrobium denitrificans 1NES1]